MANPPPLCLQTLEGVGRPHGLPDDSFELKLLESAEEGHEGCSEQARAALWAKVHGKDWRSVDNAWRIAFARCAVLCARERWGKGSAEERVAALKGLDEALLIGGPQKAITDACEEIHRGLPRVRVNQDVMVKKRYESATISERPKGQRRGEVKVLESPLSFEFMEECLVAGKPAVIRGGMEEWPAVRNEKWSDLSYLTGVLGWRSVPVEVGFDYLSSSWSQKVMLFKDFVQSYIVNEDARGYLAQHQLFDQVPELREDIRIPNFCNLSSGAEIAEDGEPNVAINAWFGPQGSVSRCHFDPKSNFLCQVFGRKKVTLYHPQYSPNLYPNKGATLSNTSEIFDLDESLEAITSNFPLFADAVGQECILNPGEMLYIPPGYWHFIRSLDISFSVSFWWDA